MCGRYALTVDDRAVLRERFAVQRLPATLNASANIKPTQSAPVVLQGADARELVLMRWGLIPAWARERTGGAPLFNARAESVADKPSFRAALRRRRCLVPATAFYEWRQAGQRKVPYAFVVGDGELFALAGLYEAWRDATGATVWSYTIITTTPNRLVAPIHDRMPVILPREHEALWLDPQVEDGALLRELLVPYPAERMHLHPVAGTL
ncbi:SOS response-associated peptidase [Kallotenue papyrolyticum]|uniref:SOS response-associated peptidase n=1 Tax=Kallotenue papyrolyticum TaxID=1325125 RepID=UPI0004786164|nr:SOS response-associated peptidase [Kallotenue papyrolyticum]